MQQHLGKGPCKTSPSLLKISCDYINTSYTPPSLPLWDQNTKGIPICVVDSKPETGFFFSDRLSLSLFFIC